MRYLFAILLLIAPRAWGAAGDIGGADITPNGLFIRIWFEGYATNVASMGIATNAHGVMVITSTNAITLTVNSPGENESEATNNLAWNQVATFQKRRNYNDQATKHVDIVGSYAVASFALQRTIHAGDWGITVNVRANFYSNNAAGSSIEVTNNSTIPQPRVIAMWQTIPHVLSVNEQTLAVQAYHASADYGRSVRAVKFWAQDSAGTKTTTNTVTSPTTNNMWMTTLNYGPLGTGLTVSNHFRVIPWAGTPLSTADGTKIPDHPDYGPLITYCNNSNLWRMVVALVDKTNGTTAGVAVTNWASSSNGTAVPFLTFAQALNAAGATNNSLNGSNNYSNCYIILTNWGDTWMGGETPATRATAVTTWTHVMPWPHINWTNAQFYSNTSSQVGQKTIYFHFKNIHFSWTNNVALINNGQGRLWFEKCLLGTNTQSGGRLFDFHTNVWFTGNDVLRIRLPAFITLSSIANSAVRMWDNRFYGFSAGSSSAFSPCLAVGNTFLSPSPDQYFFKNDQAITAPNDPFIWSYNQLYNQDNTSYAMQVAIGTNLNKGGVIANNLIEGVKVGSGFAFDTAQSQRDNEVVTNLLVWNNTFLGVAHPPFDYGYTNVYRVDFQNFNNLHLDYEYRGDVLNTTNRGTNTHVVLYSVDAAGNSSTEVNPNEFWPSLSELGFDGMDSNFSRTNPLSVQFVNNQSYFSAATNGLGTYRLQNSSYLLKGLQTRWLLGFDIDGVYRGGFDPPGAYASASPRKGGAFFGQ